MKKKLTPLFAAALFSVITLNACGKTEYNGMNIQEQTKARFQLNPNPTQAYRIKVNIDDAPGSLMVVDDDIVVGYMASNCSYVVNEWAGAEAKPRKQVSFPLKQIAPDTYEATVYLDAVLDEDYFGQGVCNWKPDGFGAGFQATGKAQETTFAMGDMMANLLEKKVLTKYYWKGAYPYLRKDDGSMYDDGYISFGGESLDDYSADRHNDLFTITVSIEEVQP